MGQSGDWNDKIGAGAVFGLGAGAAVATAYTLINKASGKKIIIQKMQFNLRVMI